MTSDRRKDQNRLVALLRTDRGATFAGSEEELEEARCLIASGMLGSRVDTLAPGAAWQDRRTFLAVAAASGEVELVSALLQAGADVGRAAVDGDPWHHTPLSQAFMGPSPECVELLLEAGADPLHWDPRTKCGPLSCAVSRTVHAGGVARLLELGADPNLKDDIGCVPLHGAVASPSTSEAVRLLLAHGADPLAVSNIGQSVIQAALNAGSTDSFYLVRDAAADVLRGRGATSLELRGRRNRAHAETDGLAAFVHGQRKQNCMWAIALMKGDADDLVEFCASQFDAASLIEHADSDIIPHDDLNLVMLRLARGDWTLGIFALSGARHRETRAARELAAAYSRETGNQAIALTGGSTVEFAASGVASERAWDLSKIPSPRSKDPKGKTRLKLGLNGLFVRRGILVPRMERETDRYIDRLVVYGLAPRDIARVDAIPIVKYSERVRPKPGFSAPPLEPVSMVELARLASELEDKLRRKRRGEAEVPPSEGRIADGLYEEMALAAGEEALSLARSWSSSRRAAVAFIAIDAENDQSLEQLLEAGVDPNVHDESGVPLLMAAIYNGMSRSVAAILRAGADPTAGVDGETPLVAAATCTDMPLLQSLLTRHSPGDSELARAIDVAQAEHNSPALELLLATRAGRKGEVAGSVPEGGIDGGG